MTTVPDIQSSETYINVNIHTYPNIHKLSHAHIISHLEACRTIMLDIQQPSHTCIHTCIHTDTIPHTHIHKISHLSACLTIMPDIKSSDSGKPPDADDATASASYSDCAHKSKLPHNSTAES
jgi:hypothetical protein